jgi:hypothetical protein
VVGAAAGVTEVTPPALAFVAASLLDNVMSGVPGPLCRARCRRPSALTGGTA